MRIATYNVEWFNALFDDDGQVLDNDTWSARWDVTKAAQVAGIARVLRALDADAVMIIEAPDTSRHRDGIVALENFAAHFGLRTTKALMGFRNDTQQEISLLYDPQVVGASHAPGGDDHAPPFDESFKIDLDVDTKAETITWSKPPLEAALHVNDTTLHLIGVHAKSKAPHGAKDEKDAMRISIENRRKQLAQCIWLRKRVEARIAADENVIVLGDFNDGPGLDEYEKLFGRSGVEIVLGEDKGPCMFDPHAATALANRFAAPTTSRFWLARQKRFLQALLDYVMVSPGLMSKRPAWRIWHPFEDPLCFSDKDLHQALLDASDHFPVTLDLAL